MRALQPLQEGGGVRVVGRRGRTWTEGWCVRFAYVEGDERRFGSHLWAAHPGRARAAYYWFVRG